MGADEECFPRVLPRPGLGQVKSYFPGAGSDPGGDVDQFSADRCGPRLDEATFGEDSGGAGEVVGHHRADEPGRVRSEFTGRQVRQRTVFQVGVDLFDDGVPAVGLICSDGVQDDGVNGGEERVVVVLIE